MQFETPNLWVILELRESPDGLRLEYRDAHGRSESLGGAKVSHAGWLAFTRVRGRGDDPLRKLAHLVSQQLRDSDLPRVGPHAVNPILAVYIDVPEAISNVPWERSIPRALRHGGRLIQAPIDTGRLQVVRYVRPRGKPRQSVELPIRVLSIGDTSAQAVSGFEKHHWAYTSEAGPGFLFEAHPNLEQATPQLPRADILVLEASAYRGYAELSSSRGRRHRGPRLVVVIGDERSSADKELLGTRPSEAVLHIPWTTAAMRPLVEFFYGIVHDYPVHEAVKAGWADAAAALQPRMYANPATNQGLRISETLASMLRTARHLEASGLRTAERLAAASVVGAGSTTAAALPEPALEDVPLLSSEVDKLLAFKPDFNRESGGFTPLVRLMRFPSPSARDASWMARERKREDRLREAIVTAGQDHRRVVDVALERTEHTPLARGTRPTPMNVLWVDRRTVLRRGARYHLAVHIGAKGIGSLVVGPQPDINQLMPQGSPSKVDVAVFADGFTVEGRNTAELAVPAFGASRPVVFPVRADGPGSQARLRVAVYRENHLLQSYVLRASIADEERRSRTNKLTVELEFSRTAGYSNLEELKPRTLAIGVNDNGDGTHQLMLKRTGGAIAIELPAAVVEKPVQDVRSILDAATYLDRQRQVARYPARVATNAEAEAVFDKTIRELAVVGRNLYRGMFIGRSRSTETLRLLRAEANHTIQVVRHDREAIVPWSVMYDYPIPEQISGVQPEAVCLGQGPGVPASNPPVKACTHGHGEPGFCIYGFWGIRHVLEELPLGEPEGEDATTVLNPTDSRPGVWLATALTDVIAQDLERGLASNLGTGVLRTIRDGEDLVASLFDDAQRPPVLVVLGHHEKRAIAGEPEGPRIVLPGGWLQASDITDHQIEEDRWVAQPRTLALLMACESAAMESDSLNDFVLAFASAGAAAVVGTEVNTFSGIAAEFAREVTAMVWLNRGTQIGEAIRRFRLALASGRNPLGFVFTAYGSADLSISD